MPIPLELRIESAEAARLAQEIVELTSEAVDEIVIAALKERLVRERRRRAKERREKRVVPRGAVLADQAALYPVIDDRAPAGPDWYDASPIE